MKKLAIILTIIGLLMIIVGICIQFSKYIPVIFVIFVGILFFIFLTLNIFINLK